MMEVAGDDADGVLEGKGTFPVVSPASSNKGTKHESAVPGALVRSWMTSG